MAGMLLCFFVIAIIVRLNDATSCTHLSRAKKFAVGGALMVFGYLSPVFAVGDDPGMQEQLRSLQKKQIDQQLVRLNKQRATDSSLRPSFVSGSQIAKGVVSLPVPDSSIDPTQYPLGIPDASSLDADLDNERAALIITAVGKEGGPIAAKKYKLQGLTFPLFIELNSQDLLFPYTVDAWLKSPLSVRGVSLTCVMDPDGRLVTPEASDRFGFAISDVIGAQDATAGNTDTKISRAESTVNINFKSDGAAYSKEDIDFLSRIDSELDRLGFTSLL